MFRAAIAVFVIGSIGCALSGSVTDFVIARIVQGMGGAMMTPVVVVTLSASRSPAGVPSGNSRRPWPRMSGWIISTYSSTRARGRNDWTSSPLPRTTRSGPGCCFSAATASAASPGSRVEFCHGSGSARVREATYFCCLFSTSV